MSGEAVGVVPDLMYAEVAHAFLRLHRAGAVGLEQAIEIIEGLLRIPLAVFPLRAIVKEAAEVAAACGLSVYDGCYGALSEQVGGVLVTSDSKLARAVAGSELLR